MLQFLFVIFAEQFFIRPDQYRSVVARVAIRLRRASDQMNLQFFREGC